MKPIRQNERTCGERTPGAGLCFGGARRRGGGGGFTLLELVVALAMFAMVVAAVVTTFFAASRLRERNNEALVEVQQVQQALTYLKRDLRSITLPSTNLVTSGLSFETGNDAEVEEEESALTLSAAMSTDSGLTAQDGEEFEFSTASGVLDDYTAWGSIQRVRYYLRAPLTVYATNGMELVRGVTRNVLAERAGLDYSEQLLLTGVRALRFSFWDGEDWLDYWDSTSLDPAVPEAVRATIEMVPVEGFRVAKSIELVVPVSVRALTNVLGRLPSSGGGGGQG